MSEVPPGLCFAPSPLKMEGHMPLLCELKYGHRGAHQAGTTHWSLGDSGPIQQSYAHLIVQLAMPPEGWFIFGAHTEAEGIDLEFWGDDGGGMPIWERPKP